MTINVTQLLKFSYRGIKPALISSVSFLLISPALSKPAKCSNYWINPNTGQQECFGSGSARPSRNTSSNPNNTSSKPCEGLKFNIEEFRPSAGGSFTEVFGTVKNKGKQTYRYIEINLQYLAKNRIIDDGFAIVTPGLLSPGSTGTWSDSTFDDRVTKVRTISMTCKSI